MMLGVNHFFQRWCSVSVFVVALIKPGESVESSMKAIVIEQHGLPNVLQIQDVPVPAISSRQLLVKVKAIGINPIDLNVRSGKSYFPTPLPYILGKEFSGIVEEVGSDITKFKVNDRVFCGTDRGAYAEYAVANETKCFNLSTKLTFSEGAGIYMTYFVAHRAIVAKGQLKPNETFIVHGASGNFGVAAVQIGKDIGARVIASVRNDNVHDLIKTAGADCIVYHDIKTDYYLQEALNKTQRAGFDVFLETLGIVKMKRNTKHLNSNGRIIVLGKSMAVNGGRQRLRDGQGYIYAVSFYKYNKHDHDNAVAYVLDAIERGSLKPIIAREYKFEEVRDAHVDMAITQAAKGKLVLVI